MNLQKLIFFILLILSSKVGAQIIAVSPSTGEQGQSLDIDITANNVSFKQGTNIVVFTNSGQSYYFPGTMKTESVLTVKTAFNKDFPIGYYNIELLGLNYSKLKAFYLMADKTKARIDSLSKKIASQGELVKVRVYGHNTNYSKAENTIKLGGLTGIQAQSVMVINDSIIDAFFNFTYAHTPGIYSLLAYNQLDGASELSSAFEIRAGANVPEIVSVIPNEIEQGQQLDVEITAENISFKQGSNIVSFKGQGKEIFFDTELISEKKLKSRVGFSSDFPEGEYDIIVKTFIDNIEITKIAAFKIRKGSTTPSIAGLTVVSVTQGSVTKIGIKGVNTHFTKNDIVYLENNIGKLISSYKIVSSSTMMQAEFDFRYAPPGIYKLRIINNTDGTMTLNNGFEVLKGENAPEIVGVKPNSGKIGESLDVEVTAQNVSFSQGTSVLYLKKGDRELYLYTTVKSNNVISAKINIDQTFEQGYYDVKVFMYGEGNGLYLGKANGFFINNSANNAPYINSVEPAEVPLNSYLDISVTATDINFYQSTNTVSLIQNGNEYPLNYVVSDSGTIKFNCITLSNLTGIFDVKIQSSGQNLIFPNGFYIKPELKEIVLDIQKKTINNDLLFYPNPACNIIHIKSGYEVLYIIDMNGRVRTTATQQKEINVSKLGKGTYYLRMKQGQNKTLDNILIVQ